MRDKNFRRTQTAIGLANTNRVPNSADFKVLQYPEYKQLDHGPENDPDEDRIIPFGTRILTREELIEKLRASRTPCHIGAAMFGKMGQ